MALADMIAAAQQREKARQQAEAQAVQAREVERFIGDVARAFGETFIVDCGGNVVYDGTPVMGMTFEGSEYHLLQHRLPTAQREWHLNGQNLFPVGREGAQEEAADAVLLKIVQLHREPEPAPEQPEPAPEQPDIAQPDQTPPAPEPEQPGGETGQ